MPGYLFAALLKTDPEREHSDIFSIISPGPAGRGIRLFILVLAASILTPRDVFAEIKPGPRPRLEAGFGYGFPEAIGIKFKYGNKIQAGLVQALDSHGFGPTGLEVYYHIGEKPRLMDQAPLYLSGGFAGYLFNVDYTKEYSFIIYPRVGRSFCFSRNTGINLDVGPGFPLGRYKNSNNTIAPVLFTGSFTIFIRF